MSGRSQEPNIRTVLGIVDGLGIPRLLAGLAPPGLDRLTLQNDDDSVSVEPVRRRTFGRAALGITLAIPLAGMEPGTPVDVTRLHPNDVVNDLYALDDRYGGAAIADIARRRLNSLRWQLGEATVRPSAETRMQSMIGALATCCAWLAFDGGDPQRARAFDRDALYAAHLANDKPLQIEVLADMSMQAKRADKPAEAINLAESALTIARGTDPRIKALLWMRIGLAAAHPAVNDEAAFARARREAWRDLDRARNDSKPAWFGFFDDQELSGLEALALMALGRHAAAARILADVINRQGTFLRNRAYYSAVRAQAQVSAGAPEEAVATISDALPIFTEVTSARTFERLMAVRDGLEPYRANQDIADTYDVLDGLVR